MRVGNSKLVNNLIEEKNWQITEIKVQWYHLIVGNFKVLIGKEKFILSDVRKISNFQ